MQCFIHTIVALPGRYRAYHISRPFFHLPLPKRTRQIVRGDDLGHVTLGYVLRMRVAQRQPGHKT